MRSFVAYFGVFGKLYAAIPFLREKEHIDCIEPFVKRDVASSSCGSGHYVESPFTMPTFV